MRRPKILCSLKDLFRLMSLELAKPKAKFIEILLYLIIVNFGRVWRGSDYKTAAERMVIIVLPAKRRMVEGSVTVH